MLFLDKSSKRTKDENGYLIIKDNPIAKAGVFQYLKSELFQDSEDNSIVNVYRDFQDLKDIKDTFSNKPIVHNHQWVGEETNRVDGSIGSDISINENDECLFADLIIYNPELVKAIENEEDVELSPAYAGDIVPESGRYNGQSYEYRQILGAANHLAVVKNGRAGKDLKIQDSNSTLKKEQGMDKKVAKAKSPMAKFMDGLRKFMDEAPADEANKDKKEGDNKIQDGSFDILKKVAEIIIDESLSDDDKVSAINALIGSGTEEVVEDEDPEKKDEPVVEAKPDTEASTEGDAKMGEQIGTLIAEAVKKEVGKFTDAQNKTMRQITDSYAKVSSVVGSFNYSGMTPESIYKYGYEAITGADLQSGLNSETAFTIAAGSRKPTFKDSAPTSKDGDEIDKLLAMHGGVK